MAGPSAPLSLSLPIDAAGLAHARRAIATWLAAGGVSGEDVDHILIATNEACMNAVEHSGASADTTILVEAAIDGTRLSVAVRDSGSWREAVITQERVHGLGLMQELMDCVHIEGAEAGTRVAMEKELTFGPARPVPGSTARVTRGEVRGATLALVEGEVDLAEAERLGRELEAVAGDGDAPLLIDLAAVTYLDSAGVHLLFRLARRCRVGRRDMRIVAPVGSVRRVLEVTGVAGVVGIDDSVDAALQVLRAGR